MERPKATLTYVMPDSISGKDASDPLRPLNNATKKRAASFDPLGVSTPLPHSGVVHPYGFPVLIKTNHPGAIEHAQFSWGLFKKHFREAPVELRIIVSDNVAAATPPVPVYRAQANLLTIVSDAANYGCCDLARGLGVANIAKATVEHGEFFRYNFLEGMVYTLLDAKHLATLHAGCVARKNCGVLLVGESGAGKSSFSYACSRRGWTYISDDASSLVIKRRNRTVLGNPHTIRFRPSISTLFPELQGHVKDRNGKPTLEIRTEQFSPFKWAQECEVSYVIFLRRNEKDDDPERLTPVSPAARLRRILYNPWPVELPIYQDRIVAIAHLMSAPTYELCYRNFDRAIDRLERLIDRSAPLN